MIPDNLLNMTNEEVIEWFRKEIVDAKPDPEFQRRYEEWIRNIENDFEIEWSKKPLKWLFKKYRQKKLRRKIELRYPGPIFWIIEDVVSELLLKGWTENEYFNEFVDIKGEKQ